MDGQWYRNTAGLRWDASIRVVELENTDESYRSQNSNAVYNQHIKIEKQNSIE